VLPCSFQSEKANCEWISMLGVELCGEFNDKRLKFQVKSLWIIVAKINLEVISSNRG
jgi:hypothetical protein